MKFSVGIITRNRQLLLKGCLDSLLKNSILPSEIIVVDNNSSDNTKKVVENFKKIFPNIKYCVEKTIGRPQARKKLFSIFDGEILAVTDDDCILDRHWVRNIKSTFQKNPKISVVQGRSISKHKNKVIQKNLQLRQDSWFKNNTYKNNIRILDTKNCALKKKIVRKISIDEDLLHEDIDIARQLLSLNIGIFLNSKIIAIHQEKFLIGLILQSFRMGRFDYQIKNKWNNQTSYKKSIFPRFSTVCKPLITIPFKVGFYYQQAVDSVNKIFK